MHLYPGRQQQQGRHSLSSLNAAASASPGDAGQGDAAAASASAAGPPCNTLDPPASALPGRGHPGLGAGHCEAPLDISIVQLPSWSLSQTPQQHTLPGLPHQHAADANEEQRGSAAANGGKQCHVGGGDDDGRKSGAAAPAAPIPATATATAAFMASVAAVQRELAAGSLLGGHVSLMGVLGCGSNGVVYSGRSVGRSVGPACANVT